MMPEEPAPTLRVVNPVIDGAEGVSNNGLFDTIPLGPRDTLTSLALRFGVSEHTLKIANDLPQNGNLALLGGFVRVPRVLPFQSTRGAGEESTRAKERRVRIATGCDERSAAFYVSDAAGDVDKAIAACRNDDAFEAECSDGGGAALTLPRAGAVKPATASRAVETETETAAFLNRGQGNDKSESGPSLRWRGRN